MPFDLLKRLFNGIVLLLGLFTFFAVPIGKKTAAQHMVAILTTKPAKEAARAVSGATRKVTAALAAELDKMRREADLQSAKRNTPEPR